MSVSQMFELLVHTPNGNTETFPQAEFKSESELRSKRSERSSASWLVYMPIGISHSSAGREGFTMCGLTAELPWTVVVYNAHLRDEQWSGFHGKLQYAGETRMNFRHDTTPMDIIGIGWPMLKWTSIIQVIEHSKSVDPGEATCKSSRNYNHNDKG